MAKNRSKQVIITYKSVLATNLKFELSKTALKLHSIVVKHLADYVLR